MEKSTSLPQKIKADETEFLYYWQEIDIIRQFGPDQLEGTIDQPVRKAIINILSEGRTIIDEDGNERTLRVMNASQILEAINEIAESDSNKYGLNKIKRSNLYYHVNALVDKGFLAEVGMIPKKNRLISYYGRTARVFLLNYDHDKQPPMLDDGDLPRLMKAINPDLPDQKIDKVIDGLRLMYQKVDPSPIHNWFEENEQELRKSDIDIRHLHNVFHKILSFDDETISAMREFAKAMNLNLNTD